MQLLLKRDRLGQVVAGSDSALLERARAGDDLVAYEESSIFDCHLIFVAYVVTAERVAGISLPHLAFGDLRQPDRLEREPLSTIQYIYDSKSKNLLCRDLWDEGRTVTELWANNPHYTSIGWYATRRHRPATAGARLALGAAGGDQCRLRLSLADDFCIVFKPDIVYFPDDGRDFLVKSAPLLLPTDMAMDPAGYAAAGRPLVGNASFSLACLNADLAGRLTIVHKQRFSIVEPLESNLARSFTASEPTARFEGSQSRDEDGRTQVTSLGCDITLLVPEECNELSS